MTTTLLTLALLCVTPPPPQTAEKPDTLLYIRTTPAGAEIRLNGKPLGTSDGLFPIKPGAYKIVVDLQGHKPKEQQITIRNGRITRLELQLDKRPVAKPTHQVIRPIPDVPQMLIEPVGDNDYEVSVRWRRNTTTLLVRPGQKTFIQIGENEARKGVLEVTVRPGDSAENVEIDCRYTLTTAKGTDKVQVGGYWKVGKWLSFPIEPDSHLDPGPLPTHKSAVEPSERKFVRIVVDGQSMTFQGQKTTWEELPALLKKVPDRKQTVLEIAIATDDLTVRQRNTATGRTSQLARAHGFEYASFIGVHPLGSKGTPTEASRPPKKSSAQKAAVEPHLPNIGPVIE